MNSAQNNPSYAAPSAILKGVGQPTQGVDLKTLQSAGQNTQLLPGRYAQLQDAQKTRTLTKSEQYELGEYDKMAANKEQASRDYEEFFNRAKTNKAMGMADNIFNSALSGAGYLSVVGRFVDNLINGVNVPVDPNSYLYQFSNKAEAAKAGLTDGLTGAGKAVADTAISAVNLMAQSLLGPEAMTGTIVAGAAADAAKTSAERGGSATQSLASGAVEGFINGVTMKLTGNISNLFKMGKLSENAVASVVGNTLKEANTFGVQGLSSSILSTWSDNMIMGNQSNNAILYRQLRDGGMGPEDAQAKVFESNVKQAVTSFFSSAATGILVGLPKAVQAEATARRTENVASNLSEAAGEKPIAANTGEQNTRQAMPATLFTKEGFGANVSENAHTPEQQRVINEFQNSTDNDILNFIDIAKNKNTPDKTSITISDDTPSKMANDIKNITGLDVSDYRINLRADTVRHIDRRHGTSGTGDTSMSNPEDIARIPYVLNNYDNIQLTGESSHYKNSDNTNAQHVIMTKRINGYFYVVEAIPDTKSKTMQIVSAYQNKNNTTSVSSVSQAENSLQHPTYGQNNLPNELTANSVDTSIPQPPENVKNNFDTPPNFAQTSQAEVRHVNDAARQTNPDVANLTDALRVKVRFEDMPKGTNGYFDGNNNTIVISKTANKPEVEIFKHELTHYLEKSENYEQFKNYVLNSPEMRKTLQNQNMTLDEYRQELSDIYREKGRPLNSTADIDHEITANFAEKLFTSQSQIDRLANTNPTLFQKIRNWISDMAYNFRNRKDQTALSIRKAENMYADAWRRILPINSGIDNSLNLSGSSAELQQTGSGTEKATAYSIKENPQGEKYVQVDTDQHIFDGADPKDYPKIARDYIRQKFQGKFIGNEDNQAFINSDSTGEYTYPANHRIKPDIKQSKMRAATELDNLLQASQFIEHSQGDERHNNVEGGWDKYKTVFKVGNKTFEGVINIKNTPENRVFYDVGQIRDISAGSASSGFSQTGKVSPVNTTIDRNINNSNSVEIAENSTNLKNLSEFTSDFNINADTSSATDTMIPQDSANVKRNLNENETKFSISENPVKARRELMKAIRKPFNIEHMSNAEADTIQSAIDTAADEGTLNDTETRADILEMLTGAGTADNPEFNAELAQAKKDISDTAFYLSDSVRKELADTHGGNYVNFYNEAVKNKVTASAIKDGTVNIDTKYQELQGKYGTSIFPDYNHPAEMLQRMVDVSANKATFETVSLSDALDAQAKELGISKSELTKEYDKQLSVMFDRYLTQRADEIQQRKDYNAQQLLDKENSANFANLRAENKSLTAELDRIKRQAADERAKLQQELHKSTGYLLDEVNKRQADIKAARKEGYQSMREKANARTLLNKITDLKKTLQDIRKKSTEAERQMIDPVLNVLDSQSDLFNNENRKRLFRLKNIVEAYRQRSENEGYAFEIDDDTQEKIDRLDTWVGGWDSKKLSEVLDIMKSVKHNITENRRASKAFKKAEYKDLSETAKSEAKIRKSSVVRNLLTNELANAKMVFSALGGHKPDSVMSQIYDNWIEADSNRYAHERKGNGYFQNWIKDMGGQKGIKKFMSEIVDEKYGLTGEDRAALYLMMKNKDIQHSILVNGRFNMPDKKLIQKGKFSQAVNSSNPVNVTYDEIQNILSKMSDKEKQLIDAYQAYKKYSTPLLNKTSESAVNAKLFEEEDYFPKSVVKTQIAPKSKSDGMNNEEGGMRNSIANPADMGFTTSRIKGDITDVLLMPLLDTINKVVSSDAKYIGFAEVSKDTQGILGVKSGDSKETLKTVLNRDTGGKAYKFLTDWTNDLVYGTKTQGGGFDKFMGKAVTPAIGFNLRTLVQQPTSYLRAYSMLSAKALAYGATHNHNEGSLAAAQEYAPVLWKKRLGDGTAQMSEMQTGNIFGKGAEWGRFLQKADNWTALSIWNAALYDTKIANPGVDMRTTEGRNKIYTEAGKLATKTIIETQANALNAGKTALGRSNNPILRSLNMFTNEPLTALNMITTAAAEHNYARGIKDKALIKQTGAKLRRAVVGTIASEAVNALAIAAVEMIAYGRWDKYDDDDTKKVTFMSLLAGIGNTFLDNITGMIPIAGNVAYTGAKAIATRDTTLLKDPLQLFDVSAANNAINQTVGFISGIAKTSYGIYDAVQKGEDWKGIAKSVVPLVVKTADALSRTPIPGIGGVPVNNILRAVRGFAANVPYANAVLQPVLEDWIDAPKTRTNINDFQDAGKRRQTFDLAINNALPALTGESAAKKSLYDEIYRLYNADRENNLNVIPTGNKTSIDGRKLTPGEQIKYRREYAETIGDGIYDIVNSAQYENADDATKISYLKSLYSYADGIATADYKDIAPGVATIADLSKTMPTAKVIMLDSEFGRKDADNKAVYTKAQKQQYLLNMTGLTPAQKQAIDAKLLKSTNVDEKTGAVTYGGADYTSKDNFALSMLTDPQQKAYADNKVADDNITKTQYAEVINALTATKKELKDDDDSNWSLIDYSVRNKDGSYGAAITYSASLVKREIIDGILDKYNIAGAKRKNIYAALKISAEIAKLSIPDAAGQLKAARTRQANTLNSYNKRKAAS